MNKVLKHLNTVDAELEYVAQVLTEDTQDPWTLIETIRETRNNLAIAIKLIKEG